MTRDEAQKLLAVLKTAYPYFYNKQTDRELSAAINLWYAALMDYEYGFIQSGLKRLITTNKYPPTIAEVIEAGKQSNLDPMDYMAIQHAKYRKLNPGWAQKEPPRLAVGDKKQSDCGCQNILAERLPK